MNSIHEREGEEDKKVANPLMRGEEREREKKKGVKRERNEDRKEFLMASLNFLPLSYP